MGFCRRCGEIVAGPKCKCGGTPVDPVVKWNPGNNTKAQVSDRWSQTYVARDKSPDRRPPSHDPTSSISTTTTGEPQPARSVSPTKRFPRPDLGTRTHTSQPLADRVTEHITSTTSYRSSSPLKYCSTAEDVPSSPTARVESGILPSPDKSELSKVYGSVLQPKESLATHSCAICSSTFPPDATIYPDPNASAMSSRFLCRPCFTANGGSRGDCPACHRPVLILKSEGGFVENSGRVWHKRCFSCESCFKNIGDMPMVDLIGRPSCVECFDNCLKKSPGRDSAKTSPRRPFDSPDTTMEKTSNIGGLRGDRKSREGSPAIEELEQRLGIVKSRESSPALEELSQRLSAVSGRTPTKDTPSRSSIAQRSGYVSSREGSPLVDRRGRGKSIVEIGEDVPSATSGIESPAQAKQKIPQSVGSPSQKLHNETPTSTDEAVEQMKKRFLRDAASSSSLTSNSSSMSPLPHRPSPAVRTPTPQKLPSKIPVSTSRHGSPRLSNSFSTSSLSSARGRDSYVSSIPSTPDLTSDFFDSATVSSAPSSPPSPSPSSDKDDVFSSSSRPYIREETTDDEGGDTFNVRTTPTPQAKARTLPHNLATPSPLHSPSASCSKCGGALFTIKDGGKYVTVPEEPSVGDTPKMYHSECFKCYVCQGTFNENGAGQAIFVREDKGVCHPECAPAGKIKIRQIPSSRATSIPSSKLSSTPTYAPVRNPTAPATSLPQSISPATTSFPRFGSSAACPGCNKSVSAMERGVVPGPQGTRWHSICLVCGGKNGANRKGRREDDKQQPGCGKKLDSAAKGDGEGGVWCRECLSLLPSGLRTSPQASPVRTTTPLPPSTTGMRNGRPVGSGHAPLRTMTQYTGATTLARQFTGLASSEAALMRQLTGGGLSPTRQLAASPTKIGHGGRPRPKSIIGMINTNMDEGGQGRGMYLVRHMTGVGE